MGPKANPQGRPDGDDRLHRLLARAGAVKDRASQLFAQEDFAGAAEQYERVIEMTYPQASKSSSRDFSAFPKVAQVELEESGLSPCTEKTSGVTFLLFVALANLAECQLRLQQFEQALITTSKAAHLKVSVLHSFNPAEPIVRKVLYRHKQAASRLHRYDEAIRCMTLAPDESFARELQSLVGQLREHTCVCDMQRVFVASPSNTSQNCLAQHHSSWCQLLDGRILVVGGANMYSAISGMVPPFRMSNNAFVLDAAFTQASQVWITPALPPMAGHAAVSMISPIDGKEKMVLVHRNTGTHIVDIETWTAKRIVQKKLKHHPLPTEKEGQPRETVLRVSDTELWWLVTEQIGGDMSCVEWSAYRFSLEFENWTGLRCTGSVPQGARQDAVHWYCPKRQQAYLWSGFDGENDFDQLFTIKRTPNGSALQWAKIGPVPGAYQPYSRHEAIAAILPNGDDVFMFGGFGGQIFLFHCTGLIYNMKSNTFLMALPSPVGLIGCIAWVTPWVRPSDGKLFVNGGYYITEESKATVFSEVYSCNLIMPSETEAQDMIIDDSAMITHLCQRMGREMDSAKLKSCLVSKSKTVDNSASATAASQAQAQAQAQRQPKQARRAASSETSASGIGDLIRDVIAPLGNLARQSGISGDEAERRFKENAELFWNASLFEADRTAYLLPTFVLRPVDEFTPTRLGPEAYFDQWILRWGFPEETAFWNARRMLTQGLYGPLLPTNLETVQSPEMIFIRSLAAQILTTMADEKKLVLPTVAGAMFVIHIELITYHPTHCDAAGSGLKRYSPLFEGKRIWRKFICPGSTSLATLADRYLPAVMGWNRNYHSHLFTNVRNGAQFGPIHAKCIDATSHMPSNGLYFLDDDKFSVSDLMMRVDDEAHYTYDFGDRWEHLLRLERILSTGDEEPMIIAGAGGCPPEDASPLWLQAYLEGKKTSPPFSLRRSNEALQLAFRGAGYDLSQPAGMLSIMVPAAAARSVNEIDNDSEIVPGMVVKPTEHGYVTVCPKHVDPTRHAVCSVCGSTDDDLVRCALCEKVAYCKFECAIRDLTRHNQKDGCSGHHWKEAFRRRNERRKVLPQSSAGETTGAASTAAVGTTKSSTPPASTPKKSGPVQESTNVARAATASSSTPVDDSRPCCVICLDREQSHACIPCGHRVLCGTCATPKIKVCPICRTEVSSCIKIFIS